MDFVFLHAAPEVDQRNILLHWKKYRFSNCPVWYPVFSIFFNVFRIMINSYALEDVVHAVLVWFSIYWKHRNHINVLQVRIQSFLKILLQNKLNCLWRYVVNVWGPASDVSVHMCLHPVLNATWWWKCSQTRIYLCFFQRGLVTIKTS